jgi:predicted amidohydrolase
LLDRAVVGIAQWLPVPGDEATNLEAALTYIDASGPDCDLIVLPELWPCGYNPDSLASDVRQSAQPIDGERTRALSRAAAQTHTWIAAGSVPEADGSACFNTAILVNPAGELSGVHRKSHLYPKTAEAYAFSAGSALTVCSTAEFGKVGLSICFDGDFPEVARALRDNGARVVVSPAAYEHAVESWWDRLYPAHALANAQWWILANQAGAHLSASFFGRSRVISPRGEVVAEATRAAPGETPPGEVLIVELELSAELERADLEAGCLHSSLRRDLPVVVDAAPPNATRSPVDEAGQPREGN